MVSGVFLERYHGGRTSRDGTYKSRSTLMTYPPRPLNTWHEMTIFLVRVSYREQAYKDGTVSYRRSFRAVHDGYLTIGDKVKIH